jgi:hypothetical protein
MLRSNELSRSSMDAGTVEDASDQTVEFSWKRSEASGSSHSILSRNPLEVLRNRETEGQWPFTEGINNDDMRDFGVQDHTAFSTCDMCCKLSWNDECDS